MTTAAPPRPSRRHGLRRDWALLAAGLLSLVFWLSGPGQLPRANHLVQDAASWLHQPRASADIVVVAIDDASIAAIGRWPWRRALHAALLENIAQAPPRAIGLDVVFSEEDWDYPGDDLLLARSLRANGRTVLPVAPGMAPLPALADAAAGLGHTQLPVDANGEVRGFYALEGPAAAPWWHMAMALHCLGETGRACVQPPPQAPASPSAWTRGQYEIIAFAQPPRTDGPGGTAPFTTYSYIDVLRGKIPAAAFRNKYVLIGTTAAGLGTWFTAPLGASTRPVPSVELLAHVLNGNLQHTHLQPAAASLDRALNLAPVLAALLALAWLGPSGGMLACLLLALASLMLAGLAPRLWQVQTAPAAALVGLALAYPLWSWLRLRAAARFLALELRDLRGQGLTMSASLGGDLLDQRIAAVEQASHQLRSLHHFVSESLRQLPSPTFVCDRQGRVLLANAAAHAYAASLGHGLQPGDDLPRLLQGLQTPASDATPGRVLLTAQALAQGSLPASSEGSDAQDRHLMLLAQAFEAPPTQGWLITLVDISELRHTQAQRDQAMEFISHDIRAPIASIITLLEMQRGPSGAAAGTAGDMLLPRIAGYAQSSLKLADDFVHLARAQQQSLRREPLDLGVVLDQAVESCWAQASAAQVRLQFSLPEHAIEVVGDAGLLHRAAVNLIGNAIKYGRKNAAGSDMASGAAQEVEATVHCLVQADGESGRIEIRDQGPGMDAMAVQRLSRPFERLDQHQRLDGVGLGLAFARTVAERHGGRLEIRSTPGQGSSFAIVLPILRPVAGPQQQA
ncbi:MAG: CHASE2 domain-containing protein [Burkholderiaceae bacterium]|jgi:CHASE2 domain-containing sensor protein/nitrogen-specific signal transduction histidine kinase|nr:CHASE2 domain-containing protein [Burkholderiaceae bacterium]